MRNYRSLATALLLTLALSASAFAGVMHTGVAQPQPQPPTTNGVMQTGETDSAAGTDTVTQVALSLLQSVLSLF